MTKSLITKILIPQKKDYKDKYKKNSSKNFNRSNKEFTEDLSNMTFEQRLEIYKKKYSNINSSSKENKNNKKFDKSRNYQNSKNNKNTSKSQNIKVYDNSKKGLQKQSIFAKIKALFSKKK